MNFGGFDSRLGVGARLADEESGTTIPPGVVGRDYSRSFPLFRSQWNFLTDRTVWIVLSPGGFYVISEQQAKSPILDGPSKLPFCKYL
jgi:hypothetical protein